MKDPLLEVRHLTTRLKVENQEFAVVDDVAFSLFSGQTLALVGESGCGKSMTALSLTNLIPRPPLSRITGEVLLEGQDLLQLSERALRQIRGGKVGMIFQDPLSSLNPVYTIGEQLLEVARLHLDLYGAAAAKRAISLLEEVGIERAKERFSDYPHQFSGGMRQRVMIAMALMAEPTILIADEPTTALDVTVQRQVLELMRELQKRYGMALLLITHDLGIVAEVAEEVAVMYAGKIVEKGPMEHVLLHPGHPYTEGLIRSIPTLAGEGLTPIRGRVPSPRSWPSGCRFHPRCPYVMEKCKQGPVPTFPCGEKHMANCWLREQHGSA